MLLSIITPTYNRAYCLVEAYASIVKNVSLAKGEIEWVIVDDGSIDNTKDLVSQWIEEDLIAIKYIYQENSGKTNALCRAFEYELEGEYTVVLDSDDIFVDDYFNIVSKDLELIAPNIGLVYLKSDLKGVIIGTNFKINGGSYVDLYFSYKKSKGDKLFFVKTDVYRQSMCRSFLGEKLIPESVFYLNMEKWGLFSFKNRVIYQGEYLRDGLSNDMLRLFSKNINGFILEKKMLQMRTLSFLNTFRNEVKYIVYSSVSSISLKDIVRLSNHKFFTSILLFPTCLFKYNRIKKMKKIRLEP